jgi:hypothetical protein
MPAALPAFVDFIGSEGARADLSTRTTSRRAFGTGMRLFDLRELHQLLNCAKASIHTHAIAQGRAKESKSEPQKASLATKSTARDVRLPFCLRASLSSLISRAPASAATISTSQDMTKKPSRPLQPELSVLARATTRGPNVIATTNIKRAR